MYPKLYNSNGQVLAVLDNIIKETASIKRVVNGEFTFAFEAYEKELKSEYFDPANAVVVDSQTFDIKYIEQEHETDVKYSIQCEHVNYRMEDGEENIFPSYTYTGTPTQILSNILAGTEFSVGTVEFTDTITITVNAEITRKSLIYELANTLGGEVDYTNLGFTINILASIGKNNGFQARFGKNLKGIRKIIDNRGGLKTYYSVDIIMLKNSNEYIEKELRDLEIIDVGDTIQLIDPVIGLDLQNRVLSREYNPIFEVNTKLEIANNIELITTKIKQIETSTVHKNKIYNGVHISAEDGFVAERSDEKAKTIMNATEGISIYSDLGDGLERNFFVGIDGRIKGKGIDIDGSGTFEGTIKANQLLIGGENGTISFQDLSDQPFIPDDSYITTITEDTITTTNLMAINLQVKAANIDGILTAEQITTELAQVNDTLTLGSGSDYGELIFRNGVSIKASADSPVPGFAMEFDANMCRFISSYTSFTGNVTFFGTAYYGGASSSYEIATKGDIPSLSGYATQSWVSNNFASDTHNHGDDYVHSRVGDNISIALGPSGIVIRQGNTVLGSIFYD